ncbi:hypothetical protein NMG60_11026650 [Bertholletia excelsa]
MNSAKFAYRRLSHDGDSDDGDGGARLFRRARTWSRLRRARLGRRPKIRIPSLRRFLRRKARVVWASWARVAKRLKESQAHFGDLFAGNYLFVQVAPTPLKCPNKNKALEGFHIRGLNYSVPRITQ